LDEGNLESVESVDSLKALLQEERLLYQTRITDLEREKEEQVKMDFSYYISCQPDMTYFTNWPFVKAVIVKC